MLRAIATLRLVKVSSNRGFERAIALFSNPSSQFAQKHCEYSLEPIADTLERRKNVWFRDHKRSLLDLEGFENLRGLIRQFFRLPH
jgi:hypothetical protein